MDSPRQLRDASSTFPPSVLVIPAIVIRKSSSSENFHNFANSGMLPAVNSSRDSKLVVRRNSAQNCLSPSSTTAESSRRTSSSGNNSSNLADSMATMDETSYNDQLIGLGAKWLQLLFSSGRGGKQIKAKSRNVIHSTACTVNTSPMIDPRDASSPKAPPRSPSRTTNSDNNVRGRSTDRNRSNSTPTIPKSTSEYFCYSNSVATFFDAVQEDEHQHSVSTGGTLTSPSPPFSAVPSSSLTDASPPTHGRKTADSTITTNFYHQLFRQSVAISTKSPENASATLPKATAPSCSGKRTTTSTRSFDPNITPIVFLTRPDFFHLLKRHIEPRTVYMKSEQLKHMVNRVRRDPSYFLSHCVGNREMTTFLNVFVASAVHQHDNVSASLPEGCRIKRHFDGRIMYSTDQHQPRSDTRPPRERTTFIDPRLAGLAHTSDDEHTKTFTSSAADTTATAARHEFLARTRHARRLRRRRFCSTLSEKTCFSSAGSVSQQRAEPIEWLSSSEQQRIEVALLEAAESTVVEPVRQPAQNLSPSASSPSPYEDRLVGFIRQPHAMSVMARRYPDLLSDPTLQQYVRRVKRDGRQALRHLSYSIRFALLVSACGHDIERYQQTATAPSGPSVIANFSSNIITQQPSHLPPSEFSLLCRMLTTASRHHHHHHRHNSSNIRHRHQRRHHSSSRAEENSAQKLKWKPESLLPLVSVKPLDFADKYKLFHRHLRRKSRGHSSIQKVKLTIKRDTCLQDAFDKIMRLSRRDLAHGCLYVRFEDELGLDYGGPLREFFALLSSELFDPYYGLFEYGRGENSYAIQINPHCHFVDDSLKWFKFAGRILALALIHGCLVDVRFMSSFYRALLSITTDDNNNKSVKPSSSHYKLAHLAPVDPDLHRSLSWFAENPISETMHDELRFSIEQDVCGTVEEVDLRPHGRYQPVTDDNKDEYIQLIVQWHCEQRNTSKQMQAISSGFREILGYEGYHLLATLFTHPNEFEVLLTGLPADRAVDVDDWRANTEYKGGYDKNSAAVKMFWNIVGKRFTEAQRLQLLVFVTGTASLPYDGFGSLRGSGGGLKKFTIEKWDNASGSGTTNNNNKLPRAHTCFNRLDLPPYGDEIIMYKKLLMAIEETEAFGIE